MSTTVRDGGTGHPVDTALAVVAVACVPLVPVVGDVVGRGTWFEHPVLAVAFLLSLAALAAGGIVSMRAGQRGNGRLMLLVVAGISAASMLQALGALGPASFLADVLLPVEPVLLGWLLLRWPLDHLQNRLQAAVIAAAAVLPNGAYLASDLFYDPVANGFRLFDPRTGGRSAPDWWPLVAADGPVNVLLFTTSTILWSVLLLAFAVLLVQRVVVADGAGRRGLVPVMVAAGLILLSDVLELLSQVGLPGGDAPVLSSDLARLALPVMLVGSLLLARGPASAVRAPEAASRA